MKKLIIVVIIFGIICGILLHFQEAQSKENNIINENTVTKVKEVNKEPKEIKEIEDWKLVLVNYENILPEDFDIELENIDEYRKFDKRAICYLFDMQKAMKQVPLVRKNGQGEQRRTNCLILPKSTSV